MNERDYVSFKTALELKKPDSTTHANITIQKKAHLREVCGVRPQKMHLSTITIPSIQNAPCHLCGRLRNGFGKSRT